MRTLGRISIIRGPTITGDVILKCTQTRFSLYSSRASAPNLSDFMCYGNDMSPITHFYLKQKLLRALKRKFNILTPDGLHGERHRFFMVRSKKQSFIILENTPIVQTTVLKVGLNISSTKGCCNMWP